VSVPTQQALRHTPERVRRARPQALVVWGAWAIALGLALLGLVEALPGGLGTAGFAAVALPLVLTTMTVGAVLVTRMPRHIVGWLLLAGGLSFALNDGFGALADYGLNVHPGSVPGAVWFAVLSNATGGAFIGLLGGYVPLYFPTGRLPSPRWWPVPLIAAVPTFLAPVANLFVPLTPGTYPAGAQNPLVIGGLGGQLVALVTSISSPVGVVALVCVIVSLCVRYRRSVGIERAQVKWFAVAGVGVILAFLVAILSGGFSTGPLAILGPVAWIAAILGMATIPLAIGVAVSRYRLYEIDQLISRTLGWGVLTLILGGAFVGLVLSLQALVAPLTRSNELAVAGSTLLVAALFQPLRRRVQGLVDRRFNRSRYDAQQAVDAFSARLRDEVDLETLRGALLTIVEATLEPSTSSLWLRKQGPTPRNR
jgi:hypothetical protein